MRQRGPRLSIAIRDMRLSPGAPLRQPWTFNICVKYRVGNKG